MMDMNLNPNSKTKSTGSFSKVKLNSSTSDASRLSNENVITELRKCVAEERKLTLRILNLINEVSSRRLYADLGFPSLFEWLVKDLRYSESAAMRRIQSARALQIDRSIAQKVESGQLTITNLAKAQSVIRAEEKRMGEPLSSEAKLEVVRLVESKSSREAEVGLANQFPAAASAVGTKDSLRPIGDNKVRMQVTLTQAQLTKLKRVREVASHSHCGADMAEVIEMLADQYLKRKDPLVRGVKSRRVNPLKNKRCENNPLKKNSIENSANQGSSARKQSGHWANKPEYHLSTAGAGIDRENQGRIGRVGFDQGEICNPDVIGSQQRLSKANTESEVLNRTPKPAQSARKAIKPSLKHLIFKRAQGQCEYFDAQTGRRCRSRYLTEIDHIHPVALGGDNDPTNLRILCRSHNQLMAKLFIGS